MTAIERISLISLVKRVLELSGEPKQDWQYHIDLALSDPQDARTCYEALLKGYQ